MAHDVRKSLLRPVTVVTWWITMCHCVPLTPFFSVGSHLLVRFGGYPPLRMWLSAVGEGPCSIKIFQVHDRRAIRRLLTPPPVRSLSHDPCSRITNPLSILWTTGKVICWYVSFSTVKCISFEYSWLWCYWTEMTVPAWKGVLCYLNKYPAKVLVCSLSTCCVLTNVDIW